MTDRADEARAESERQWPELSHLTQAERAAWKAGGRWADANPKSHTITRAEFKAAEERFWNWARKHGHGDLALLAAFHRVGIEVEDEK